MAPKPIVEHDVDLNGWRRRVASEDGPPSTTRLVLLVLSLHMNKAGGSCYPKVETLIRSTGLSERAVSSHLREAKRAGWISIGRRAGKYWRQRSYQATWPDKQSDEPVAYAADPSSKTSPAGRSADPGSADPRSGDPNDPLTGTSFLSHLCVNQPGTIQGGSPAAKPEDVSGESRSAVSPEPGPTSPNRTEEPVVAAPGLRLDALVNGLVSTYPHPTNRGAARRVPDPISVEDWIGKVLRKGKLQGSDYEPMLAAAKREARIAERDPESYRKTLRTWIVEGAWREVVEEEPNDSGRPALPPPSKGPRFTPLGWATGQPKETNEPSRLDDGGRA